MTKFLLRSIAIILACVVFSMAAAAPTVSSISPEYGPAGTSITILGANFGASQGTSSVIYNGKPAEVIHRWSDTSIIATVPTEATSGSVVVIVAGVPSNEKPFKVTVP